MIFFVLFVAVSYVLVSVATAIATANRCNSVSGGAKSWVIAPPHWECDVATIRIGR